MQHIKKEALALARYCIFGKLFFACLNDHHQTSTKGDSGGPFSVKNGDNYEINGIVSFGYDCAKKNEPGIYADVLGMILFFDKKH